MTWLAEADPGFGRAASGGGPSDLMERSWGVAKLVKAPDFDSGMRGFESYLPSQIVRRGAL